MHEANGTLLGFSGWLADDVSLGGDAAFDAARKARAATATSLISAPRTTSVPGAPMTPEQVAQAAAIAAEKSKEYDAAKAQAARAGRAAGTGASTQGQYAATDRAARAAGLVHKKPEQIQKRPYGSIKLNPTVSQANKLLGQAAKTAMSAMQTGTAAMKQASASVAATPAKPPARVIATPVTRSTRLGAAPLRPTVDPSKAKTPKQKAAVQKFQAAQKKAAQARQNAATSGKAARAKGAALVQKMKAQKGVAVALRTKKGAGKPKTVLGLIEIGANTEIGAQLLQDLNDYYTYVGAAPDPLNPGYLDDGSLDPAWQNPADLGIPDITQDSGAPTDPNLFTGQITDPEWPAAEPMDTFFADYKSVPGAIPYDGRRGTPDGFIGSYRFFTRETDMPSGPSRNGWDGVSIDWTDHYGFVFGKTDALDHGGDALKPGTWNHVHGGKGRKNFYETVDATTVHSLSQRATCPANPNGTAYGPIVGNPKIADWKGLRADAAGNLFWFPQEAPEWATLPLKQAAAATLKAEKDARDATNRANADRLAQQQADNELARVQQEAANALAESQAASEQAIAQTQIDTQAQQMQLQQQQFDQEQVQLQSQQDAQTQQLLAQQAQMEMEQQRAESTQQQQVQELLLSQARREQEYLAQHPEQEFAPGSVDEAAYDEGGGEYVEAESEEAYLDEGGDGGGWSVTDGVEFGE